MKIKNIADSFKRSYSLMNRAQKKRVREELAAAFNLTTRASIWYRVNGFVNHTPSERVTIEKLFNEMGIGLVWDNNINH